jgi:hypothetical protein
VLNALNFRSDSNIGQSTLQLSRSINGLFWDSNRFAAHTNLTGFAADIGQVCPTPSKSCNKLVITFVALAPLIQEELCASMPMGPDRAAQSFHGLYWLTTIEARVSY